MTYRGSRLSYLLTAVICLTVGWFSGQEYLRYEIRTSLQKAFSGFDRSLAQVTASSSLARTPPDAAAMEAASPIEVALVGKKFDDIDLNHYRTSAYNTFTFLIKNTSTRSIRAFDGVIVIRDVLGNVLQRLKLVETTSITSLGFMNYDFTADYNPYEADDDAVKRADKNSLQVSFEPEKILYTDGEQKTFATN